MKPDSINNRNIGIQQETINTELLNESEKKIFDSRPDSSVISTRIKSTSTLESFKAFVQQAINAIRAAFNFKTHQQIPASNIKADIIPKVETIKNGINNQLIVDEVNAISLPLNNRQASSNDSQLDDFEIIESLDDFNMVDDIKIQDESKNIEENILVETTSLVDEGADGIKTENYGAFANWYKSGADMKAIPDDAIGYAKYLIRTHVDNEKIKDIPELLAMVESAKNLVEEVERKEPSLFELGLVMKVDAQKEIKSNASFGVVISERSDENALKKYLNQESQRFIDIFYPENFGIQDQSEINQIKNDAKTFLIWRSLWTEIMTKSELTVQNYVAVSKETPTEEKKKAVANEFKQGESTVFNNKHLASTSDLEVCKRFIEKYESVEKEGSDKQKEELNFLDLDKYIQDFKEFYLYQQAVIMKDKKEEKIKKEEHLKKISPFDNGIKSFMSLRLEQSESLYLILKPKLELKEFQKVILDAKNYFSNISEYKPITEIQRNAALSIATNWNTFKAKSQLANAKSEESGIFGQIGQIFSRDLLAELQAFPNFEKLNALLSVEKISNDFK